VTWDFLVTDLRDLVRPVVLDLRGRGLSSTGDDYRSDDFAADAAATITELGLERPIVIGHSLGARVATVLATAHDVELRSLIVVDPPLSGPDRGPYPTSREAFQAQLDEGHAGTTGDAVRAFYPKWPRSELLLRARWLNTCDTQAVLASYEQFAREDFFDWWPAVTGPAAFMRGAESPVVTEAGAAEAAAANPGASQHVIADAGHMVPWDNRPAFMAELRALLEDHLAQAS
jgi:N-formylmaleamate deformylase